MQQPLNDKDDDDLLISWMIVCAARLSEWCDDVEVRWHIVVSSKLHANHDAGTTAVWQISNTILESDTYSREKCRWPCARVRRLKCHLKLSNCSLCTERSQPYHISSFIFARVRFAYAKLGTKFKQQRRMNSIETWDTFARATAQWVALGASIFSRSNFSFYHLFAVRPRDNAHTHTHSTSRRSKLMQNMESRGIRIRLCVHRVYDSIVAQYNNHQPFTTQFRFGFLLFFPTFPSSFACNLIIHFHSCAFSVVSLVSDSNSSDAQCTHKNMAHECTARARSRAIRNYGKLHTMCAVHIAVEQTKSNRMGKRRCESCHSNWNEFGIDLDGQNRDKRLESHTHTQHRAQLNSAQPQQSTAHRMHQWTSEHEHEHQYGLEWRTMPTVRVPLNVPFAPTTRFIKLKNVL